MLTPTVQQWLQTAPKDVQCKPFPPEGDIIFGAVRFDDAAQVFRITMGGMYAGTYDMEAERLLTGASLLDFIWQIHSKEWATGQHLKDFLDCVLCWAYREHKELPQMFFGVAGGKARLEWQEGA